MANRSAYKLRRLIAHSASGSSPTCEDRQIASAEEWAVLKTTAIQWSGWREDEHKVLPIEYWGQVRQEVRAGDVIVTKAGPRQRVGVACFVDDVRPHLTVSGKMILLRSDPSRVDPRYLSWYMSTPEPQAYLDACKTGMAEAQMNVTNDDLMNMTVLLPDVEEQGRIASYLDAELRNIDNLLDIRRRQSLLLSERYQADLIRSITGMSRLSGESSAAENLTVESCEPGVLSRGAPPTWQALSVRRVLEKIDRPARFSDAVVTAYRDGEVTLRSKRREQGYTLSAEEEDYQGVEPGDLVFHALDGFAGAVGVSDSRGKASPVYHVCRAREGNVAEFTSFALRAMGVIGYLEVQAGNVRQRSVDFRNWEYFARISIPVPPHAEQIRIARSLELIKGQCDAAAASLRRQCELLVERRRALVTAAVTGQIDVATARGAG